MPHELVSMEHQEEPRIETDFMYMKSDGSVCETLESGEPPSNEWCTILTAVDKDSSSKLGSVHSPMRHYPIILQSLFSSVYFNILTNQRERTDS